MCDMLGCLTTVKRKHFKLNILLYDLGTELLVLKFSPHDYHCYIDMDAYNHTWDLLLPLHFAYFCA